MNEKSLDRITIYNRWLEFALNLADILDVTPTRKERIKKQVTSFITMYSPDSYAYADKPFPILGWDRSSKDGICIGDHAHEHFGKYELVDKHGEFKGKFYNQIASCIRAGLDVAVPDTSGGGVVGFTIGDIRRAYKNNIPQWLNEVLSLCGDEPEDESIWL